MEGEILICDKVRSDYNFISKNEVKISVINLNKQNTSSINHSYKVAENTIFIKQPHPALDKEKSSRPIGWIFRRTLYYVSLDYVNDD